jgi:hypothetical protein
LYFINGKKAERIDAVTFSELGIQENDIEEILSNNRRPANKE